MSSKKSSVKRSGVVRCQKCLKYGHYTYECQNQHAYRYRPSRTVIFKQKLQHRLDDEKPPETTRGWDGDQKRTIVPDVPSSDEEGGNRIINQEGDEAEKLQDAKYELLNNEEDQEEPTPTPKRPISEEKEVEKPKKQVEISPKPKQKQIQKVDNIKSNKPQKQSPIVKRRQKSSESESDDSSSSSSSSSSVQSSKKRKNTKPPTSSKKRQSSSSDSSSSSSSQSKPSKRGNSRERSRERRHQNRKRS